MLGLMKYIMRVYRNKTIGVIANKIRMSRAGGTNGKCSLPKYGTAAS